MYESRVSSCAVKLLDGESISFDISKHSQAELLVDKVCNHLALDEKEYFGLLFLNAKDKKLSWLDPQKTIKKQLGRGSLSFYFAVKFFPPSPNDLQQELTRYLFVLQLRQDLLTGRLTCSSPIHALLASYLVQAELGDYEDLTDKDKYLNGYKFMPDQQDEFLDKVKEFHKKHVSLTPAEAEFQYLENARKLPLYGIQLHEAVDSDGSLLMVGVSSQGVHIVKQGRQINKFAWPCVMQFGFRGKRFLLDVRAVTETEFEDMVVVLNFASRNELKRMYRVAVDYHSFFRRSKPQGLQRNNPFLRLGSKFRYSGRRTFIQTKNAVYGHLPPSFTRVDSRILIERVVDESVKSTKKINLSRKGDSEQASSASSGKGEVKEEESLEPGSPTIVEPKNYTMEEESATLLSSGHGSANDKIESMKSN